MIDRVALQVKAAEMMLHVRSHSRREVGWAYRHGLRTASLSLWLREKLFPGNVEMDEALYVAALFHDCAKTSKSDHGHAGSLRAAKYLKGFVEENTLFTAKNAINKHNKRGTDSTALEKVLQDADIIDHHGTIEVWLNVSYSVLGGEGPERSMNFYDTEWANMINELRVLFNYELSLKIYNERVAFNEEFIKRLRVESAGGIYNS